jgi:GAF domain-containing protein
VADAQPVFEKIVDSIGHLFGTDERTIWLLGEDAQLHVAAIRGPAAERTRAEFPRPLAGTLSEIAIRERRLVAHADVLNDPGVPVVMREIAQRVGGNFSFAMAPMLWEGRGIGTIGVRRTSMIPFSEKECDLLRTFADQAVIAIQNARLFEEVQAKTRDVEESLQQQIATSEVLEVISSSMGNAEPVFEKLLENATRVCGAEFGAMGLYSGEVYRRVALYNVPPAFDSAAPKEWRPELEGPIGTVLRTGQVLRIDDLRESPLYLSRQAAMVAMVEVARARTLVVVPMLRDAEPIGQISIYRQEVRPFTDKQVDLLRNFANQAVIAIENARLFNETKEALARQTATADVLKVIASSPSNLQPVFDAIAERSKALIGAHSTIVVRLANDMMELAAFTPVSPKADEALQSLFPRRPADSDPQTAKVLRGEIAEITDAETDDRTSTIREAARARGWRSQLLVPLKDENGVIGWISITRKEVGSFAEKDVELLRTFADQAVIAIQNVELFEQVQNRTRELSESLQFQTATADVLKVISRAAFDLQTVLDTLVESATQLCEADDGVILQPRGDGYGVVADWGLPAAKKEFLWNLVFRTEDNGLGSRVLIGRNVVHIHDVLKEPGFDPRGDSDPARTRLGVPLLRDGTPVGVFVLTRRQVCPFTDRQIELVQTFASQAVIAIENARLFNETKQALEQQTATADILKVIASSPDNVQPVFDAIAVRSNQLVGGLSATVSTIADDALHLRAFTPVSPEAEAALKSVFPLPLPAIPWRDVMLRGETFRIVDIESDDPLPPQTVREMARLRGYRSALFVPLMRDGRAIGTIAVTRVQPGAFADHHVQLLKTFADQAVIAISNVELFKAVQDRTSELSRSLDDLRAAQDRLVQTEKLASLGQLTAGIAHEIKNPLNFINNFSALSGELIDELDTALAPITLDAKTRGDVGELTALLKSNLGKVVQHGKRADSIVKNMLLHSREGKGERRSADINALVEESLNLAYHGARAERSDFQITLARDLDPAAGEVDLPAGDHARAAQHDLQRVLCCNKTRGRGGQRVRADAFGDDAGAGELRRNPYTRQWHRHSAGGEGEDVQPVLYDKTARRGDGPRPVDDPRHRREAAWRHDRHRDRAGAVYRVFDRPAAREIDGAYCVLVRNGGLEVTSPRRGEVGLRSNPGEGPQLSRGTVTPHPDRIWRCDPTSPNGRGEGPARGLIAIPVPRWFPGPGQTHLPSPTPWHLL